MDRFSLRMAFPLRSADGSFEAVKERAFDGSDYDDDSFTPVDPLILILGLLSLPACILIFAVAVFISTTINRAKLKKRMRQVNYFRDIPNKGNLNLTYYLGLSCDLFDYHTLLGAYLLRLISQGCLEPTTQNADDKTACLRLSHPPKSGNTFDDALYAILEEAAGADGTLQPKELETYCKHNGTPLVSFLTSCRQDYMVYAMLLGIADKVTSQIKAHYPAALPQVEQYEVYLGYSRHYNRRMRHTYGKEYEQRQAARSGGRGGRASRRGGRASRRGGCASRRGGCASSGGGRGGSR